MSLCGRLKDGTCSIMFEAWAISLREDFTEYAFCAHVGIMWLPTLCYPPLCSTFCGSMFLHVNIGIERGKCTRLREVVVWSVKWRWNLCATISDNRCRSIVGLTNLGFLDIPMVGQLVGKHVAKVWDKKRFMSKLYGELSQWKVKLTPSNPASDKGTRLGV